MTVLSIKPLYTLTSFKKLISAITFKKIQNLTFETIHQRKDGSTYPISILLQLFHQQHDQAFFVACLTDISQQKSTEVQIKTLLASEQTLNEELLAQTEELLQTVDQTFFLNHQLKESQQHYQLLANHIEDMVTLHNMDGHYLYASPSFLEKTGYQASEIIGQSGYVAIHPDEVHRVFSDSHEHVKRDRANRIKWRCRHKYGYYFWVETISKPLTGDEGNFIVCCSRDITLQHEMEEKNQQYMATLSAVLESSNNLIYTLNAQKRFIVFNSAFQQLARDYFGTMVQLNGHSDAVFLGSGHEMATRQEWENALSGEVFTVRRAYVAPGLPELVFDIFYNPIKNKQGQIMGVAVFSQNITEKVFAENEFKREVSKNREILNSITDAMLALDHNWCFTYANQKAQEILNKSFEEIQGQNLWLLYGKALENSAISEKLLKEGYINPVQITAYIPSVAA